MNPEELLKTVTNVSFNHDFFSCNQEQTNVKKILFRLEKIRSYQKDGALPFYKAISRTIDLNKFKSDEQ